MEATFRGRKRTSSDETESHSGSMLSSRSGLKERTLKGEVDDLQASVYCQMATCKRDLMIDRDFRLGIGANQFLGDLRRYISTDERNLALT
jgi:hypothetical protein